MKIQLLLLTCAALGTIACANVFAEYPYSAKEAADVSKPVATEQEAKAADEELAKLKQHLQTLGEPTLKEKAQMEAEGIEVQIEETVEPMAMPSEETKETAMIPEPAAMQSEPEEMKSEVEEPTMGSEEEPMEAEQPKTAELKPNSANEMRMLWEQKKAEEIKGMEMPGEEESAEETEEMPDEKPAEM